MNQARQFIVHRHITVGDKEVNSPSILLTLKEEAQLIFKNKSALADEEHPERKQEEISKEEITVVEKAAKKEVEKETKPEVSEPSKNQKEDENIETPSEDEAVKPETTA